MRFTKTKLTVATALLSIIVACGGVATAFQDALTLAPSFITTFETAGKISPELASTLRNDVADGRKLKDELSACKEAIPSTAADAERKLLTSKCYVDMANNGRKIFSNHWEQADSPEVRQVAQLINDSLQLIINHYGQPEGLRGGPVDEDFDKTLENKLKDLEKALKVQPDINSPVN
jgi:hypothetical protein